jgi:hypothetical protein
MTDKTAVLSKRELDETSGWVVDAIRPGCAPEQLLGVFTSSGAAEAWILNGSEAWRCVSNTSVLDPA